MTGDDNMSTIGVNGSITTYPGSGEKICAGCEHWKGKRCITENGSAACTDDNNCGFCSVKKVNVFPGNVCICVPSSFKKWVKLK